MRSKKCYNSTTMWRSDFSSHRGESEFLDEALARIYRDQQLIDEANQVLKTFAKEEPLFKEILATPQSPKYHAEGPMLEDHLRHMLVAFFGVLKNRLKLTHIEEFRSMKGFTGEFRELEEIIKENAGFFKAFILLHDIGKKYTIGFEAPKGSKGAEKGFHDSTASSAIQLAAYSDLFHQFAGAHIHESDADKQFAFYSWYEIEIHYRGHERVIHRPVFKALLERVGDACGLRPQLIELLEDIIAYHMDPIRDFAEVRPTSIKKLVKLANNRGRDSDDFIDILQACVFLDAVCASKRRTIHGSFFDPSLLINFLKSEHAHDPFMVSRKEKARNQDERERRNQILKESGLDGEAIMELLGMEPGPLFGRTLLDIQEGVLGKHAIPTFGKEIDNELQSRAQSFYENWFDKDV